MSSPAKGKMWGGRFASGPDAEFYEFERSLPFDRRLLPYELALDRAWAKALVTARVLDEAECGRIVTALQEIENRAAEDPAWIGKSGAEDIHGFVEGALIDLLGPLGAKLHTGRSRNEMVATEFRMFVKDAASEMRREAQELVRTFAAHARKYEGVPMAGMTHLQPAQPILFSHWLLAHAEPFLRDAERLAAVRERADTSPMGSGALAGSAFHVEREQIARDLGFSRMTPNSLDAAGDRDFALEYLFALSVLAIHLSRLAEDMVLFAIPEFGYVFVPDAYSTGSSLMPQKKNPDSWELIRGKSGRIAGALVSLLMTMKGLPSSYQRDLQEDKEPVFAAHEQALAMLRIATGAVAATRFDEARLRTAATNPALLATEAADYLVARGVPFREAHEIVGKLICEAEQQGKNITELALATLKKFSSTFQEDFGAALTVEASLARRRVAGGTAPESVREELSRIETRLEEIEGLP